MRRSIVILSAVYALCLASAATTSEHDVGTTCDTSTSNSVQLDGTVTTCQTTTEPAATVEDKALAEDVLPAGPAPARRKSRDAKTDSKAGPSAPKQRRAESPDALRMLGLPSPRQARSNSNRKAKRAVNAERPINDKKASTEEKKTAKVEKQSKMESAPKKETPTSFKPVDLPDAQAFRAAFAAPWKRAPVAVTNSEEIPGVVNNDKTKPASRKIPAHSEKRFPSTSSLQGSHENSPQLLPLREIRERIRDLTSPSTGPTKFNTAPLPESRKNEPQLLPLSELHDKFHDFTSSFTSPPGSGPAPLPDNHKNEPLLLPLSELREKFNAFSSGSTSPPESNPASHPEIPSAAERVGLPSIHDRSALNTEGDNSSSPMPQRSRRVEQFVKKLQSRKINVKSPKWLPQGGFLFVG